MAINAWGAVNTWVSLTPNYGSMSAVEGQNDSLVLMGVVERIGYLTSTDAPDSASIDGFVTLLSSVLATEGTADSSEISGIAYSAVSGFILSNETGSDKAFIFSPKAGYQVGDISYTVVFNGMPNISVDINPSFKMLNFTGDFSE